MLLKKKVREMVVTKFLSVMITVSLVLTSISTWASAAPMTSAVIPTMMVQQGQINTNIIPFNVGRVTDTAYNGEGRVLVTIQDLHSHRQTQENINSILKILDSKYGIKNIWLEGASGTLDTSWLANISDKKIKEQAIETLLSKGKLTGAELFSIQANRPTIIKGLENKDVYLTNFERLYEIYNNKNEIESYLPKIKAILDSKTEQYYSIENKKINNIQEKNKKGEIKADKYFAHIIRAANRAGINLSDYDQIAKYAFIIEKQKDINFRKVNEQISEIINKLKETLNYQQYKSLIEKVNNKETETEFYTTIKEFAEEKGILSKYKEAVKFFDYIQYNEMLNPIILAEQEEEFINDIETNFAKTGYEKDVLFLRKYFRLIESYLNNKITADEYRYFKNNETKFKLLWVKYVDVDGIIDMEKYFGLFNDFYKDNVERNRYFIENVTGTKPAEEKDAVVIKASDMYNSKAVEELTKEKDGIDVVITGGFHTRGLSRLFEEEKINYLVITPNVTDETLTSEKLYDNLYREEYEVVKEKFALMPVSELIKSRLEKAVSRMDQITSVEFENETLKINLNNGAEVILIGQNEIESEAAKAEFDIKEVNEQAKLAAQTFLDLQEYLKSVRENVRKHNNGEKIKDVSGLKAKVKAEIENIADNTLKERFSDVLKQSVAGRMVDLYTEYLPQLRKLLRTNNIKDWSDLKDYNLDEEFYELINLLTEQGYTVNDIRQSSTFQGYDTQKWLYDLGAEIADVFSFFIKDQEKFARNFGHTAFGVAIGILLRPYEWFIFLQDREDVEESHGALSREQIVARPIAAAIELAVFMAVGFATMNVLWMIAAFAMTDFLLHFTYNEIMIHTGRAYGTFQARGGIVSQEEMKERVAKMNPTRYDFLKDSPILGYLITEDMIIRNAKGEAIDVKIPEAIRKYILNEDGGQYSASYYEKKIGRIIVLQTRADGTPDFYIAGNYTEAYKEVPVSEVETKASEMFGYLMGIEGLRDIINSGDHIVGALKKKPVSMISMAELGYDVSKEVTIQSPWGEQTKPAGRDAYLVFDEGQDQYYMVNEDPQTGYPIKYVPATETSVKKTEQADKIKTVKDLIGKTISCYYVENRDEQFLEYSQYEGLLKIESIKGDRIDIVRIEDGKEIHLFDQQVVNAEILDDGEIIIEIVNKYTERKGDTLKLHARAYSEKRVATSKPVSVEVETGLKYERGEITNDVVESPMRPTAQQDVFDPTKLSKEEQLALERKGAEALLDGTVSLSMLMAGASSRMNVNEAPEEIKEVVAKGKTGVKTMGSKAAVPITKDGTTYFGIFMTNIARLFNQLRQQAGERNLAENEVLLMTNEDYAEEHQQMLDNNDYYGFENPERVRFFKQPLGAKYIANISDARKMRSKYDREEDYYKALWYSADIALRSKEEPEVIVSQERDPLGHGEYFHQMIESGELLHLIDTGKQYVYVKNVDNYAAKFDKTFLIELGYFIQQAEANGINFMSEVSQRVSGLKGGSWFVDEATGSQFAVEDPTLNETKKVMAERAAQARAAGRTEEAERLEKYVSRISVPSFGFNDAVAFFTPEYVANLYLQDGQTFEEFLEEYRTALAEKAKGNLKPIQQIAQRGRSKFPQLLDPKPAKKILDGQQVPQDLSIYEGILTAEEIAKISQFAGTLVSVQPIVAKIETNMWQSTSKRISPLNRVTTTLVKNGRNIDIMDYQNMSWNEKIAMFLWWKFAATKQWDKSEADKEKIRKDLNEAFNLKEGDEGYVASIDDPRVLIVCESYIAYEKLGVAEDIIRYITGEQLIDDLGFTPKTAEKPLSVETATGLKYLSGEVKNDVVESPMRPTEESDIFDPTKLSRDEQLRLERKGAEALLDGEVSLSMLMGGASSRMNVNEAPEEIKEVVASGKTGVKTMGSKAAVPVTKDGTTYFGIFMTNIAKLFEQLRAQAGKRKLGKNEVLLMTNEDYAEEHENMLDANDYYGLTADMVKMFKQQLGATYIARLADVKKIRSKFKDPKDYYKALWYAAKVLLDTRENPDAVVSPERAPLGHGEYFHQLIESGELIRMFDSGKKYIYVKNVDNFAAKFDRTFLIELGYFIEQTEAKGINFLAEVSERAAGMKGGSWFVDEATGSHFAVEDPTLNATIAYVKEQIAQAKKSGNTVEVKRLEEYLSRISVPSFGFNDAVAFFTPVYVANLYLQDGQTLEEFLEEYKAALSEKAKGNLKPIQEIAQRGRSKFPQLIDPKPGKVVIEGQQVPKDFSEYDELVRAGLLTEEDLAEFRKFAGTIVDVPYVNAKIETNMWQSTSLSPENKVATTRVKNGRNVDMLAYPNMTEEEKISSVLPWWRFAATKQWSKTPAELEKIRQDLNQALKLKEGDEGYIASIDDPRVLVVSESYEGYARLGVAEDAIAYITDGQLVDDLSFEKTSSVAQVLQNLIRRTNDWLQIKILGITSLFKVKAEVIAVVDADDVKAINEARALAESGVKVKMILLNYDNQAITDETGNIIYTDRNEALFELARTKGSLNVITYEALKDETVDAKTAVRGILDDIRAGNIIGQQSKNVLYISPSLLDGQEDITDEYTDDKSVLAISTNSIKGAIAKGLLNYSDTRIQALNGIQIPKNLFGMFKVSEYNGFVTSGFSEMRYKGINVMLDVTGEYDPNYPVHDPASLAKTEKNKQLSRALLDARANGCSVIVFGENADKIKGAVKVGIPYDSKVPQTLKENQIFMIGFNEASQMKGDLSNFVVTIAKSDRENIVLTPEIIESLINRGATIAFDGEVLKEIDKDSTSENGITMLDIIKAMFADTPEQKAAKYRAKGKRAGRLLNIAEEDIVHLRIYETIKNLQEIIDGKADESAYVIVDASISNFIGYLHSQTRYGQNLEKINKEIDRFINMRERINKKEISYSEFLGLMEGILEMIELEKVMPNIKDTDRVDNMNELMERLVEYRLLTGKSYNPQEGAEVIKTLSDKTPDEIMRELQSMLQEEDLTDDYKAYVLNGIIELLLADNTQLDKDMSEMLDINTNKLHALLSAA